MTLPVLCAAVVSQYARPLDLATREIWKVLITVDDVIVFLPMGKMNRVAVELVVARLVSSVPKSQFL